MGKMYIHKMPGKQRQELVDILNVNDRWHELGVKYLNIDQATMNKFARTHYRPGDSPADALLSFWGSKNHTVKELFLKLKEMEHYQGMEVIKGLVDPKYHYLINYNNESGRIGQTQSRNLPIVPPPIQYNQAQGVNISNLDFEQEKNSPLKKMVVDLPTMENDEYWDAKKPGRIRRQSSNATVLGAGKIEPKDGYLNFVPFEEVKKWCKGFTEKLGHGGFGEVFKGEYNVQEVAVKRIRKDKVDEWKRSDPNFQKFIEQFWTELTALHQYPAENILRLMCASFSEDLSTEPCLVYEFMPNGSVWDWLYKKRQDGKKLTWLQRCNIAAGTAKGLIHLHSNEIVHGDIKSGNILLDKNMEPKIGDFGLARGGPTRDCQSHITVSSIAGTEGYLPDEYLRQKKLSYEVDVYCYGMVLFELVTAKTPRWKHPHTKQELNSFIREVDHRECIDDSIDYHRMAFFLYALARECTFQNKKNRAPLKAVYSALTKLQSTFDQPAMALQIFYDEKNAKKPQMQEITSALNTLQMQAAESKSPTNQDLPASDVLKPPESDGSEVNGVQVVDSESEIVRREPAVVGVLPEIEAGIPGLPAILENNSQEELNATPDYPKILEEKSQKEPTVSLHYDDDDTDESIEESIYSTDTYNQEMSSNNPPPNLTHSK